MWHLQAIRSRKSKHLQGLKLKQQVTPEMANNMKLVLRITHLVMEATQNSLIVFQILACLCFYWIIKNRCVGPSRYGSKNEPLLLSIAIDCFSRISHHFVQEKGPKDLKLEYLLGIERFRKEPWWVIQKTVILGHKTSRLVLVQARICFKFLAALLLNLHKMYISVTSWIKHHSAENFQNLEIQSN